MPQKGMLYSLIVICLTILLFTWMVRDPLCELHIRQGNNELAASLACDSKQQEYLAGVFSPPFLWRYAFSRPPVNFILLAFCRPDNPLCYRAFF